jgi:hypothetical protein
MIIIGDLIEAYHRNYLDAKDLNEWALALLEAGYEGEAVITAAACADLTWAEVAIYFKRILKELNITDNLEYNIDKVKEEVFLREYILGLRLGGQILQKFDNLRKEIGFYDIVGFTMIGDDYKGKEQSGYHTIDRKLFGEDLENEIRIHLKRARKI